MSLSSTSRSAPQSFVMTPLEQQGAAAKAASYVLASAGTERKNEALEAIAKVLTERKKEWLEANAQDLEAARTAGMRPAMLDRLTLTEGPLCPGPAMNRVPMSRPSRIPYKSSIRAPLGVIAIIYEARPNVTVDAAALCLKSGNTCILRGGKEAIRSNRKAAELMRAALAAAGPRPPV